MGTLRIKRIYDDPEPEDGTRILVDRLWPRGISKERAHLNAWMKDVAPTSELRKWWGHDPARFDAFAARYRDELAQNEQVEKLLDLVKKSDAVTLLYAARDPEINHAKVLRDYILESQ
ncbi:MAG: DUF488 domain-containing protein [Coriobacteriales bacterium]|jgi:uncharacterized protein YeaO (DUF488 family)